MVTSTLISDYEVTLITWEKVKEVNLIWMVRHCVDNENEEAGELIKMGTSTPSEGSKLALGVSKQNK